MQHTVAFLLLLASTAASIVLAVENLKFLLMVASGRSPDTSAVVSAVDQTLEEINMTFSFQLNYKISDTQVSDRRYNKKPLNTFKYYCTVSNTLHIDFHLCSAVRQMHSKHFMMRCLMTAQWWQWWGVAALLLLRRWPKLVTCGMCQ